MSQAQQGFAYSQDHFRQLIEDVLAEAKHLGASDAGAEVSEGCGLSVSVRRGALENVERNRDKSLGVSVYLGQRRGNASTSDFSPKALKDTVRAAFDIARFTAEDEFAGLPAEDELSLDEASRPALDLFHPWDITAEAAAELALRCERAALDTDPRITKALPSRPSNRTSSPATAGASGAVTPARGIRCRWRQSLAVAPAWSGTRGTAPCGTPPNSPARNGWGVMPPSGPWPGSRAAR
jgi:PmbA protein